jgi:pre-rRNA-processing protein TSR2
MHPNKSNFVEGTAIILSTWTALRIAVQNEFGGPDSQAKADWLVQAIVEHFDAEGKGVEVEDLEDILLDVMAREFQVSLEDESEREMANLLFNLYRQCITGNTTLLESLRERQKKALATSLDDICHYEGSDDSGDDDVMEGDVFVEEEHMED